MEGINLGLSRTKPGYVVWSPEYGFFTSSNVTFFETVFPFRDGTMSLPAGRQGNSVTGAV